MRISTFVRSAKLVGALMGAVMAVGAATEAKAVVLAYDGFNYTAGAKIVDANGDLTYGDGLGSATDGWAGAWDNTQNGGGVNPDTSSILAGSLAYKDSLGNMLTTTGGRLLNTGAGGVSQPGRNLMNRRDGVALDASESTPVPTWLSFLGIRSGQLNDASKTPSPDLRLGTFSRGANLTLFDVANATEQKLNLGENSNFQFPFTTGDDFLRIQREDLTGTQIDLWRQSFGKSSTLAQSARDVWMINGPLINASIDVGVAPTYNDPDQGPVLAERDWQKNPSDGRFRSQMSDVSFGGAVAMMLVRIDHFGGAAPLDKVTVWMNPNLNATPSDASADMVFDPSVLSARFAEQTLTGSVYTTATGGVFSFDRIRLFAGENVATAFAAEWSLDEIRVGETFGDVTPHTGPSATGVPEPGSLVLAAFALAAARGFRRRA